LALTQVGKVCLNVLSFHLKEMYIRYTPNPSPMKKLLLILAVIVLGCQSQAPLSEADRENIKKCIDNLSEGIRTASADMLKNAYTEDVISMPPNATENSGSQKVVEFHSAPGPVKTVSFALSTVEIEGSGDQAYVRGTWTFTGQLDSTQINDNGKFLAIVKKQGSDWKISRETWNADTPLPGN
jgi:ketosteroid isomerase-like protein